MEVIIIDYLLLKLTRDKAAALSEAVHKAVHKAMRKAVLNVATFDELICDAIFTTRYASKKDAVFYFQGRELTHGEAVALLDELSRKGLEQNYDALEALDCSLRMELAKQRVMVKAGHRVEYSCGIAIDDPELARRTEHAIEEAKAAKPDLAAKLAYRNRIIAESSRHLQIFLILWDMRRYAEEHGFHIHPSSTLKGGLTACCLDITNWKDCSTQGYSGTNALAITPMPMVASGAAFRALYAYLLDTYYPQIPDFFGLLLHCLIHEDLVGLGDPFRAVYL